MKVVATSSVKEAGYAKETQMCCVHSRLVHVETLTERSTLVVKKFRDEDLKTFLTKMSTLIIKNAKNI